MICDLAETYHIYDYKSLPVDLVATFVSGLRDNSRLYKQVNDLKVSSFEEYLLVNIFDDLNWLCWTKTKGASKGRNKPLTLMERLNKQIEKDKIVAFSSGDAFMEKYNELARR